MCFSMEPEQLSGVEDQVWEDMNGPSALFWRLYGSGRDYGTDAAVVEIDYNSQLKSTLLWRLMANRKQTVAGCTLTHVGKMMTQLQARKLQSGRITKDRRFSIRQTEIIGMMWLHQI